MSLHPSLVGCHYLEQLIEKLGLQYPFLLFAPTAQPIDLVLEGRIIFSVQHVDHFGREFLLWTLPGHFFVQINEVRPIDSSMGAIDDDEHLSRELAAPAIEQDARHFHLVNLIGMALL